MNRTSGYAGILWPAPVRRAFACENNLMKTRPVSLLIVGLLATAALVNAQQPPLRPDGDASQGPAYVYPNGIYCPYPGILAPVPYPGWGYPPHWIYSYMFTDPAYRRPARNLDNETG